MALGLWMLLALVSCASGGYGSGFAFKTGSDRRAISTAVAAARRLHAEPATVASAVAGYLSNEDLEARLQDFVERCHSIARLVNIGKSVKGR